ncbi:MAG TPA: carboxypeptidase-like regulatory domain-containing protein [Thermoanaerobaculia bacterium]|nr:carboxypeptidase-like regulatory domain-containing protein [Thermoanaerobaculia bacterium]
MACALVAAASDGSSIVVTVKCHSVPDCDTHGIVFLQSATNKSLVRRLSLAPAGLTITEQSGSEWDLGLEAKGFWALPQRVAFPAGATHTQYTLHVWRTGTLQGVVKLPDPQPATPIAVRVVVSSRPEPKTQPEVPRGTSFDCATEKTGQWKCALPAALLDVAVRVEGYAPYHKWDVKVAAAGVADLGAIKLQRGASVVAWLSSDFAKQVAVPVRASLRRDAAAALSATAIRLALPVAEGNFTKKGVVQLAPIAPGTYILEIQARGYATEKIPVQLYEGKETTPRRSFDLLPAQRIRLHVQPPVGPGGVWWRVELWRRVEFGTGSQSAGAGIASPEGIFEATDQVEGPVRVFLKDAKQNTLANKEIRVAAGTDDYTVSLDVTSISGNVTIGDSPLPSAHLLFGGSGGAEKIRTTTDGDGHFAATLPRGGKWIVDVEAPQNGVAATTEVTIEKDEVDIALPATEVSGSVRDANGKRLPRVRVMLWSAGGPMMRLSESDGSFRFRGTSSGKATLRANDSRTHDYSKPVDITVPEDGALANIEITLDSVRPVKVMVRSNGEAVVGALAHSFPFLGASWERQEATTDLDGTFTFNLPASATDAVVTVAAPGRPLESFRVPIDQDSITLELASRGGTLQLRWKPGDGPASFTFNDHFLESTDVFLWARSQGAIVGNGTREIPNVAPGKYRFCSASHCAEGLLAIGGQLVLDATH